MNPALAVPQNGINLRDKERKCNFCSATGISLLCVVSLDDAFYISSTPSRVKLKICQIFFN